MLVKLLFFNAVLVAKAWVEFDDAVWLAELMLVWEMIWLRIVTVVFLVEELKVEGFKLDLILIVFEDIPIVLVLLIVIFLETAWVFCTVLKDFK